MPLFTQEDVRSQVTDDARVDTIVRLLLKARMDFHILHLQSVKHSKHVVLNEVYDLMSDSADRIAEQALGGGLSILGARDATSDDAVSYLQRLIEIVESLGESTQDPVMKNLLEEVVGEMRGKLYKLELT